MMITHPGSGSVIHRTDSKDVLRRKSIVTAFEIRSPETQEATAAHCLQGSTKSPLLTGLAPDVVWKVLDASRTRICAAGEMLFQEGHRVDEIHLPLGGLVELFTAERGRDQTLLIMAPGEVFLPGAVFDDQPHPVSARMLSRAKVLLIDRAVLRDQALKCPLLAQRIASITAAQVRTFLNELRQMRTRTGPQRLAALLLQLIDQSPVRGSAELPFPKKVLASRSGLTAETLSRSIRVLTSNGIAVRNGRAILLDRDLAERFCRPTPHPTRSLPSRSS